MGDTLPITEGATLGAAASSGADTSALSGAKEDSQLADLGVLLVHGIGQSHSGDTLSRFGEPLVDWIADWVGNAGDAEVEVLDAVLGVEAENPDMPAHSWMTVSGPHTDGSGSKTTRWLLAESWWAESFLTPSFGDIATWGCQVVPWTAFYHFHRRLRRASARFGTLRRARPARLWMVAGLQVAFEFATLMVALLLAPIGIVVLMLLVLLGLLPIPSLRRLVARVQRGLALTIGDSYALLGPKIGSAAIYGRVARQMQWMEQRAKRVAVVAHSQGAAVAYRVVSRSASDKCRLLITFGAGIRKLTQIRLLNKLGGKWVIWNSLAVLSLVIAAMVSRETLGLLRAVLITAAIPLCWFIVGMLAVPAAALFRKLTGRHPGARLSTSRRESLLGLLAIALSVAAIVIWFPGASRGTTAWVTVLVSFAWGWLFAAYTQAGEAAKSVAVMTPPEGGRAAPATEKPLPERVRWLDFFAASDPVSNGPIFDDLSIDPVTFSGNTRQLESRQVHNRNSLLTDHTTYWQNAEDFIAEVVAALGRLCDLNLSDIEPLDEERLLVARHRRRWRVRWLHRVNLLVVAAALCVWFFGDLQRYTVAVMAFLINLVSAMPILGRLLDPSLPDVATPSLTIEAITLAISTMLALAAVNAGWSLLDKHDKTILVERRPYPTAASPGLHPALPFHFAWLLVMLASACLIMDWVNLPWWGWMLALAVLFFVAAGVAGASDIYAHSGAIRDSWPRLKAANGQWDQEAQQHWQGRLREATGARIELVTADDGRTVWRARLLEAAGQGPDVPQGPLDQFAAETLFIATAWSQSRSARQVASVTAGIDLDARNLLLGTGDDAEVIDFWSTVLGYPGLLPPQRAEALLNRGLRRAAAGQTEAAIADYSAVITMRSPPQEPLVAALYHRGNGRSALGDVAGAWADYTALTAVAEADRDYLAPAYANRGWLHYEKHELDAFYADTGRALALDTANPVIGFNMGLAALLTGKASSASDHYTKTAADCDDPAALKAAIADLTALTPESLGQDFEARNTIIAELGERLAAMTDARAALPV